MPVALMGFTSPPELFPPHEAVAPLDARVPLDVGFTPAPVASTGALNVSPRDPRSDDTRFYRRLDVPLAYKAWHLGGVRLPNRGV